MTTPTRTIVNVQTGEVSVVELQGAELEAYNAAVTAQVAEQSPAEPVAPTEGQ